MAGNLVDDLVTITIGIETRRRLEALNENGKLDFDQVIKKLLYCPLLSYKPRTELN